MYIVKRPAYEFVFAVPKAPPLFLGTERAFFQVRFKDTPEPQGFVLSPEELEDFSAGLNQLMEYVRTERNRKSKS